MSNEYEIGIVPRAENSEKETAVLRVKLAKAEADRDRYLSERNQILNHLADDLEEDGS